MASQQVIERLTELQAELETISSAVNHIDEAAKVAKSSSEIIGKVQELLSNIKELEEKHQEEILKVHLDKINRIENKLQNLLTVIEGESKHLGQLVIETKELNRIILEYFTEIKKIDFPERLGKIDNQISGINIGVGNLQTSIQNTQTKIDENQKSIILKFAEMNKEYEENYKLMKKEIKTSRLITISIGVVMLIVMLIILLK